MKTNFNETAVHYLEQATAQLGPCGNEACKFFINLAIDNIKQQESFSSILPLTTSSSKSRPRMAK